MRWPRRRQPQPSEPQSSETRPSAGTLIRADARRPTYANLDSFPVPPPGGSYGETPTDYDG